MTNLTDEHLRVVESEAAVTDIQAGAGTGEITLVEYVNAKSSFKIQNAENNSTQPNNEPITNISGWPVMKVMCPTCPFKTDANGRERSVELATMIRQRCLTKASQICHDPALKRKEQNHLCRGARDFQLQIFHRLGVIDVPTDEAWSAVADKIRAS